LVVDQQKCCTATVKKPWPCPKMLKMRFSGHLCARLLRTLANVTKQTTLPTIWEWAQQQQLIVDLTMVASNWDVNE
jgi:hypothetical protein